jgi:hypothetical protein
MNKEQKKALKKKAMKQVRRTPMRYIPMDEVHPTRIYLDEWKDLLRMKQYWTHEIDELIFTLENYLGMKELYAQRKARLMKQIAEQSGTPNARMKRAQRLRDTYEELKRAEDRCQRYIRFGTYTFSEHLEQLNEMRREMASFIKKMEQCVTGEFWYGAEYDFEVAKLPTWKAEAEANKTH